MPAPLSDINPIGLILAGGQSRRMGGTDKFLLKFAGTTLISQTTDRLSQQLDELIISTNSDHETVRQYLPCESDPKTIHLISDDLKGFAGPLAGIHAAMKWTRENRPAKTHLITIAADTPFFPANLTSTFIEAAKKSNEREPNKDTIVLAKTGDQVHPVFGLWPLSLYDELGIALAAGVRKIRLFTDAHLLKIIPFSKVQLNGALIDPFFNINTPEDWAEYQALITSHEPARKLPQPQ